MYYKYEDSFKINKNGDDIDVEYEIKNLKPCLLIGSFARCNCRIATIAMFTLRHIINGSKCRHELIQGNFFTKSCYFCTPTRNAKYLPYAIICKKYIHQKIPIELCIIHFKCGNKFVHHSITNESLTKKDFHHLTRVRAV